MWNRWMRWGAVGTIIAAAACEDSTPTEAEPVRPAGTTPTTPVTPGTPGTETPVDGGLSGPPAYMVQARVSTPDGQTGYFVLTPSLEDGVVIDTKKGIEEPGGGRLYAETGKGLFFIGGGETPTLTRYTLAADGTITKGVTISFASKGVGYMAQDAVTIIDDHKAYLLDPSQTQFIEFDPTLMEIRGSIPITGVLKTGFDVYFGKPFKRADGIFFSVFWVNPDYDNIPGGSAVARLDPSTSTVGIVTDSRCANVTSGYQAENGDLYWFTARENAIVRRFYHRTTATNDCALRIKAGATTFDPSYMLDLTARLNGAATIFVTPSTGSKVWVKALDETIAPVPSEGPWYTLTDLGGWRWYQLEIATSDPVVRNDSQPPATLQFSPYFIDGRSFVGQRNAAETETVLLELLPTFTPRAKLPGTLLGLARIR